MSIVNSEFSTVSDRLMVLVDELAQGKKTVFAQKAGIPKGTFYGYLKGGVPHSDHLVRIQETFSASIDWILTGRGTKYIVAQGEQQPLDPNPEIADLMERARRVLTSGNHVAFDALERNIRYFDQAIAAEKRADVAEKEIHEMKQDMELIKKEIKRLKDENQRLDEQGEDSSSNEKTG